MLKRAVKSAEKGKNITVKPSQKGTKVCLGGANIFRDFYHRPEHFLVYRKSCLK